MEGWYRNFNKQALTASINSITHRIKKFGLTLKHPITKEDLIMMDEAGLTLYSTGIWDKDRLPILVDFLNGEVSKKEALARITHFNEVLNSCWNDDIEEFCAFHIFKTKAYQFFKSIGLREDARELMFNWIDREYSSRLPWNVKCDHDREATTTRGPYTDEGILKLVEKGKSWEEGIKAIRHVESPIIAVTTEELLYAAMTNIASEAVYWDDILINEVKDDIKEILHKHNISC